MEHDPPIAKPFLTPRQLRVTPTVLRGADRYVMEPDPLLEPRPQPQPHPASPSPDGAGTVAADRDDRQHAASQRSTPHPARGSVHDDGHHPADGTSFPALAHASDHGSDRPDDAPHPLLSELAGPGAPPDGPPPVSFLSRLRGWQHKLAPHKLAPRLPSLTASERATLKMALAGATFLLVCFAVVGITVYQEHAVASARRRHGPAARHGPSLRDGEELLVLFERPNYQGSYVALGCYLDDLSHLLHFEVRSVRLKPGTTVLFHLGLGASGEDLQLHRSEPDLTSVDPRFGHLASVTACDASIDLRKRSCPPGADWAMRRCLKMPRVRGGGSVHPDWEDLEASEDGFADSDADGGGNEHTAAQDMWQVRAGSACAGGVFPRIPEHSSACFVGPTDPDPPIPSAGSNQRTRNAHVRNFHDARQRHRRPLSLPYSNPASSLGPYPGPSASSFSSSRPVGEFGGVGRSGERSEVAGSSTPQPCLLAKDHAHDTLVEGFGGKAKRQDVLIRMQAVLTEAKGLGRLHVVVLGGSAAAGKGSPSPLGRFSSRFVKSLSEQLGSGVAITELNLAASGCTSVLSVFCMREELESRQASRAAVQLAAMSAKGGGRRGSSAARQHPDPPDTPEIFILEYGWLDSIIGHSPVYLEGLIRKVLTRKLFVAVVVVNLMSGEALMNEIRGVRSRLSAASLSSSAVTPPQLARLVGPTSSSSSSSSSSSTGPQIFFAGLLGGGRGGASAGPGRSSTTAAAYKVLRSTFFQPDTWVKDGDAREDFHLGAHIDLMGGPLSPVGHRYVAGMLQLLIHEACVLGGVPSCAHLTQQVYRTRTFSAVRQVAALRSPIRPVAHMFESVVARDGTVVGSKRGTFCRNAHFQSGPYGGVGAIAPGGNKKTNRGEGSSGIFLPSPVAFGTGQTQVFVPAVMDPPGSWTAVNYAGGSSDEPMRAWVSRRAGASMTTCVPDTRHDVYLVLLCEAAVPSMFYIQWDKSRPSVVEDSLCHENGYVLKAVSRPDKGLRAPMHAVIPADGDAACPVGEHRIKVTVKEGVVSVAGITGWLPG
eukprot:jgi/Mesvir1/13810/Mv15964-RA.1